jgi:hypothetical protein
MQGQTVLPQSRYTHTCLHIPMLKELLQSYRATNMQAHMHVTSNPFPLTPFINYPIRSKSRTGRAGGSVTPLGLACARLLGTPRHLLTDAVIVKCQLVLSFILVKFCLVTSMSLSCHGLSQQNVTRFTPTYQISTKTNFSSNACSYSSLLDSAVYCTCTLLCRTLPTSLPPIPMYLPP